MEKNHKEDIENKEKHIDELHRKIGELTISVDFLKKHREAGISYPQEFDRY